MNWLERARREMQGTARQSTANSAERNLTAVMAVPNPGLCEKSGASIRSNDGAPAAPLAELEAARQDFEERAAIMEFDGGLSRDDAEREAKALTLAYFRLPAGTRLH